MRQVILLRGINLGSSNRVPMAELRAALADAGLPNAKTYVQSGNVVVDSDLTSERLRALVEGLLKERFELSVPVVTRTAAALEAVVNGNPFAERSQADPKHVQVTFLAQKRDPAQTAWIGELAAGDEAFVATLTELYSWHPHGIARSKLALALTGRRIGAQATVRNWTTVTKLLEMATGDD